MSVYAPTNDKDDQEKEIFYGRLEETCNKTPKHDTVIIMGDFNAKLGNNEYPQ
jgi:exonuclease III